MKKTLFLLLLVFSTILNSAVHEVRTEQEFENAVRSASPEDEIKLMNPISLVNGYNYSESNKNGNGYGSIDLNGIKLNGNGHRLKMIGRNIVLHGTSVFQDIDITLGLPDSTSEDNGDLKDLSKTAIIYANGHNLTLDNVSFTPETSDALGVRPTIIMGSAPSIPSGISSEDNTLTIANSTKPVELRTIVAGSYNTEKTTKTIINLDSKVNLVGSPNAEILLKNLNNDSNLSVDVVNESKDVRTFKTTDTATDVNINLKNVEYGENANKLVKFDGKINNLSLNDGTKVVLYSPLNANSIELKKSNESQTAPELKVSKSSMDSDDDFVIPNQANGSITANKVISNNSNSKIILDQDATIKAKTVEGEFQFDGDDKKFEGYTPPTNSSETDENNPEDNSQPPQNLPVDDEDDKDLQGDDPNAVPPTENPSGTTTDDNSDTTDSTGDTSEKPKSEEENPNSESEPSGSNGATDTADNQGGSATNNNSDDTDSTGTGEDSNTEDSAKDTETEEEQGENASDSQDETLDKENQDDSLTAPMLNDKKPEKSVIKEIEIPLNGNMSRIVSEIVSEKYENTRSKRVDGIWAVISNGNSKLDEKYKVQKNGVVVGYEKEFDNYTVGGALSHDSFRVKEDDVIVKGDTVNGYIYGDIKVGQGKVTLAGNVGSFNSKLGDGTTYGAKVGYEHGFKVSEKVEITPLVEVRHLTVKEKSYKIPETEVVVEGKTVNYVHSKVGTKLSYIDNNLETYAKYALDFNLKNKEEVRDVNINGKPYINKNKKADAVVNEFSLGANYKIMENFKLGLDYRLKKAKKVNWNTINLMFEYIF